MICNGKKYLVTADNWFYAPDGHSYRSAWGECNIIKTEEAFGFTPTRPSTNWFLKVGSDDHHIIIAGCQIHFAIRSEERPVTPWVKNETYVDKDSGMELVKDRIYYAEETLCTT